MVHVYYPIVCVCGEKGKSQHVVDLERGLHKVGVELFSKKPGACNCL